MSREQASVMVKSGEANWLVEYVNTPEGVKSVPGWNVVRAGQAMKSPRAHVIEKAHMERATLDRDQEDRDYIQAYEQTLIDFYQGYTSGERRFAGLMRTQEPLFVEDPWEGRAIFVNAPDLRTNYGRKRV